MIGVSIQKLVCEGEELEFFSLSVHQYLVFWGNLNDVVETDRA